MECQIFCNLSHHCTSISECNANATCCSFWTPSKFINYPRLLFFKTWTQQSRKTGLSRKCRNPGSDMPAAMHAQTVISCIPRLRRSNHPSYHYHHHHTHHHHHQSSTPQPWPHHSETVCSNTQKMPMSVLLSNCGKQFLWEKSRNHLELTVIFGLNKRMVL